MKIVYSHDFSKEFKSLPKEVQNLFKKQEAVFKNNWKDSRLKVKKLKNQELMFSFRITRAYRVLFVFVKMDTALFLTIAHRKDVYN